MSTTDWKKEVVGVRLDFEDGSYITIDGDEARRWITIVDKLSEVGAGLGWKVQPFGWKKKYKRRVHAKK